VNDTEHSFVRCLSDALSVVTRIYVNALQFYALFCCDLCLNVQMTRGTHAPIVRRTLQRMVGFKPAPLDGNTAVVGHQSSSKKGTTIDHCNGDI